jgi:hypothetical protein
MDEVKAIDNTDSKLSAESAPEERVVSLAEQNAAEEARKEENRLKRIQREDKKFAEAYSTFKSEQDSIIKKAEQSIPKSCPSCNIVIHDAEDKSSMRKNNSCFTCHSETEKHKTTVMLAEVESRKLETYGNMELSDYENWLFGDEMGHRSLAVLMSKLKTAGYNNYKPWQVSLAAASYSKSNYNKTDLVQTRHALERTPIARIIENIPADMGGVKDLVATVKRAEAEYEMKQPKKANNKIIYAVAGIGAVSAIIPLLLNKRG